LTLDAAGQNDGLKGIQQNTNDNHQPENYDQYVHFE